MESIEVLVKNKLGLHARASAKLTEVSSEFESEIALIFNNQKVNAKSIMGVMMLAASLGSKITVEAEGDDESEALKKFKKFLKASLTKTRSHQCLF